MLRPAGLETDSQIQAEGNPEVSEAKRPRFTSICRHGFKAMPSRKAVDTQTDILTSARGELLENRSWHKSQRYV
jgi:hypothetical protein